MSHQVARGVCATLIFFIFTIMTSPGLASFSGLPGIDKDVDRDATLNRALASFPKTLNPVIYSSAAENDIINKFTIFEQLIVTDPDTGAPMCWLCVDYAYDKTEKNIIIMNLRKDVTFHDGTKMTAEHVKKSYEIFLHPKVDNLNYKGLIAAAVEKIEVLSPHKIKIVSPAVKFTNIYQLNNVPIIPTHLFPYFDKAPEKFNKDKKFGRNPVGTGPYKFKKWQAGKFVELRRNAKWWGFKDPKFKNLFNFKKIRFKFITNDNVRMQAFKKGEFDYTALQSFQFDDLRKDKGSLKVAPVHLQPKIGTSWMFVAWNGRLPIFKDKLTREALAKLTDRFSTLAKFSKGLRPPTNGPWGIKSPEQCPVKRCPVVPFDPAAAKKLLAQAGWKDTDANGVLDRVVEGKKQELSFTILASSGDYSKNVLGVYVTEFKKAGIDAKIRQLDWTAMTKLVDDLNFQAYFSGWRNGFPINPRQLWHSEGTGKKGSNTTNFVDKVADKLIDQIEREFDPVKRRVKMRELHTRIYDSYTLNFHHEGGGCYVGRNKNLLGVNGVDYMPECIYWPRWYKGKANRRSH